MTIDRKRRGSTWQDGGWRRHLVSYHDISDRAHRAFDKLKDLQATIATTAATSTANDLACACTPAPHTGDGDPARAPLIVRPEYRGFA